MQNNTAAVLILLAIGLFYVFTNVQYRQVQDLQALANEYQEVLKNVSLISGLKEELLVAYNSFSVEEIERINKVLPDNVDNVRLALDLDAMAAQHGIALKSVRTSPATGGAGRVILPENESDYDRVTVSFSFVAGYENFKGFLKDLEKSLRIMDIESASFQSGDSSLYEYKVAVETYWLKDQ